MKLQTSPLPSGSKVTGGGQMGELDADTKVHAIVKVSEAHYVPRDMALRSRIDPHMMTVECRFGALPLLENDPRVVSIAVQKPRS